jgi:hypothetical protein
MHGSGIYYRSNGNKKYVGEVKNNKKDGRGTFYCLNGTKYIGEFEKNYKHGYGFYARGNKIYESYWVKGEY